MIIKKKVRIEAICYLALLVLAHNVARQSKVRKALENESELFILAGKKNSFKHK
jgi:hypothetical protein